MEVWVFEDNDIRYRYIKYFLKGFTEKVKLKRYTSLGDAISQQGNPDVIAIDTTLVGGEFPSYVPKEKLVAEYRKFRCFVEKHLSSRFLIYCAVKKWADDFCDALIEDFKDSVVIEVIEGTSHSIAQRLYQISGEE